MSKSTRTKKAELINLNYFKEIYENYVSDVSRFVYRISLTVFHRILPKEDIADIVQDIFVAFYQSLPKFRHKSQLKTYLLAIAYKIIQKKYRDCPELLNPPISLDEPIPNSKDEDNLTVEETLPALEPSPEESLHTKLLIQTVLSQLSKEQAAILIWEYLGELSPENTIKLFSRSRQAFYMLRYRALKQARKVVNELKCYQNKISEKSQEHLNNFPGNLSIIHSPLWKNISNISKEKQKKN